VLQDPEALAQVLQRRCIGQREMSRRVGQENQIDYSTINLRWPDSSAA
jgi:hypothetical protein